MAAQNFRDVWSKVLLHAPTVPAALAQSWVQDAYDKLIANRHWAWTRRTTTLVTLASRAPVVTFVQGSPQITSSGGFSPAIDAGRQIRVNNAFIYTIASVQDVSHATLTQPYMEISGAQAATISDIYLSMPADFRSFDTVLDMVNSWPIVWWISKERLDWYDPARMSADSRFRVLVAHQIAQDPTNLGRVTYEAWPHPTAAGTYVLNYFVRTDSLQNDVAFQGVLATYTKALQDYALAQAAQWPGTLDQRNPYFNLPLSAKLEANWEASFQELNVMDDDQYLMDLAQVDLATYGLAALSASTNLLQHTDATVGDYFGGYR